MTKKGDPEDIILWPDGSWCSRRDLAALESMSEAGCMSYNYEVIYWGSKKYYDLMYSKLSYANN